MLKTMSKLRKQVSASTFKSNTHVDQNRYTHA